MSTNQDRRFSLSLPLAVALGALALLSLIALARAAAGAPNAGASASRAQGDAPADALDRPELLAVSEVGEVYVAMWTDTATHVIARFTDWGGRRETWRTEEPIGGLAVGPDQTVYASLHEADRIQGLAPDLTPSNQNVWQADGLRPPVAAGIYGRSMGGAVYALVAPGVQAPDVVRFGPRGAELGRWQVEHSAYDLAVGGSPAGPDGQLYVVDGGAIAVGGGHLVRYTAEGRRIDAWDLPGKVHGIDTNAEGLVYAALVPYRNLIGFVHYYDPEGAALGRCELPGLPMDLAVDRRSGDFYAIVESREHIRTVQHYSADCKLLDTWDERLLGGFVTRTPPPPTAGAGTGTATGPGPTPTPDSATAVPTATRPPGAVYLPVGLGDVRVAGEGR